MEKHEKNFDVKKFFCTKNTENFWIFTDTPVVVSLTGGGNPDFARDARQF